MQTLFKPNLFSNSSSKVGAKNFVSGGKKLGSSIVGAARNNIIGFNRTAQAMVPEKKEENQNSFIKNYTNFFGSKKTEKILRKNLKLIRDSLVNTFEIARHLKAAIISISGGLKGKGGAGGGGLFGGIKSFLAGALGGALVAALPVLLSIAAIGGLIAFGIALWKSEKFREATLDFIKFASDKIWKILKPFAISALKALIPSFINGEGGLNWQEGETPSKVVNQSVKDVGAEKTLELLRKEYNQKKEDGSFDSVDGKLTGLENEMLNQMGRVEGMIAKKEKTKSLEQIMTREIKVRTGNIRDERLKTDEWRNIQNMQGSMEKARLQTAYHKETKEMIRNMAAEIEEKYKQILIKGSTGGSIHESISEKGKNWEGSSIFDKPASSSSVSSDVNAEVSAVKSDLNTLSFADSLKLTEKGNVFTFEPITFANASESTSGGDVSSTSSSGTTGGDAITFYSSSNSDPTYHKLNALMTFNIV